MRIGWHFVGIETDTRWQNHFNRYPENTGNQ